MSVKETGYECIIEICFNCNDLGFIDTKIIYLLQIFPLFSSTFDKRKTEICKKKQTMSQQFYHKIEKI